MAAVEGPRVAGEAGRVHEGRQPADDVGPVRVGPEDRPALAAAHRHALEDPGRIEARVAGRVNETFLQHRFRSTVPNVIPGSGTHVSRTVAAKYLSGLRKTIHLSPSPSYLRKLG